MRTKFPSALRSLGAAGSLLFAGCETTSTPAPVASPSAPSVTSVPSISPLQDLDYSGDQSALAALDRDFIAAGKDTAKLAALEKRLIDLLKRPDGSIAARQAACERLGFVLGNSGTAPSAATLKLLGAMLADPRESDIARLALAPVPGAEVDKLFVDALGKTSGKTRRGIIVSLTERKPPAAIAPLRALLTNEDASTVAAAATALGQIGSADALAALRNAHPVVAAVGVVTEAKLQLARSLPTADGIATLAEILRDTTQPANRRATALRGLLDLDPATGAKRIVEALDGKDWTLKEAAVESIFTSKAPGVIAVLAAKLSSWDAPTQAAVVTAFGRRGDADATSAVVTATQHTDAAVRAAALGALGFLPASAEHVALLAKVAAADKTADAKLAKAALARLNGPGVSAAVLSGAESGDAALRIVFLEQLALRNLTEGLPLLRKCRDDASVAVRSAAIAALGDLAPPADQALVLDWAASAKDSTEQTRALRAVVNITLRNPDTAKRAQPVFALLEKSSADVVKQVLPALPRLGGTESAECAAHLALRNDAAIADAAASTLARWPDRTSQPSLITVATKGAVASARNTALTAALRYFERNREVWTGAETAQLSQLLAATTDADLRKRLTVLLNRAADKEALALAEKLSSDSALGAIAKEAALCIAANLAGTPKARVSASESSAGNLFDGKTDTAWRVPTTPDQWIEIDFTKERPLHRITLDETGRTGDFPEKYEVYVTTDPEQLGKPIAAGAGQRNRTAIDFPAGTKGRYVIIKNTAERPDGMWSVCEVFVD